MKLPICECVATDLTKRGTSSLKKREAGLSVDLKSSY